MSVLGGGSVPPLFLQTFLALHLFLFTLVSLQPLLPSPPRHRRRPPRRSPAPDVPAVSGAQFRLYPSPPWAEDTEKQAHVRQIHLHGTVDSNSSTL